MMICKRELAALAYSSGDHGCVASIRESPFLEPSSRAQVTKAGKSYCIV